MSQAQSTLAPVISTDPIRGDKRYDCHIAAIEQGCAYPFDETNLRIAESRQRDRDALEGVRIGDYIRKADGTLVRVTWFTSDGHCKGYPRGSFSMYGGGFVDHSGTVGFDSFEVAALVDTGDREYANFWLFHHGSIGAGRRVDFKALCRVFSEA